MLSVSVGILPIRLLLLLLFLKNFNDHDPTRLVRHNLDTEHSTWIAK